MLPWSLLGTLNWHQAAAVLLSLFNTTSSITVLSVQSLLSALGG
jgi:hypothetical protein